MQEILPYASPEKPLRGRPLPQWGWLIAFLLFPIGPFIALAIAQLLSWRKAVILAVFSYGSNVALVMFMVHAQNVHSKFLPLLEGTLPATVITAWSLVIYRIGRSAHYWSARTRRICTVMFWVTVALIAMSVLIGVFEILKVFPHSTLSL